MKNMSLIGFLIAFLSNTLIAQVPQAINYQAVARDNAGLEIVNTNITVRFSIGAAGVNSSTFDYQETHATTTNAFGLFNVRIGQGTPSGPAFNAINWNTQRYLLVEVNFGSGFEQMGAAQPFVSVPYAVLAQNVLTKELPATANNNDILSWNGAAWVATAPGSVSETTTTLVDNGNGTFTYTNELGIPVTFDANIPDGDSDATNELQTLSLAGTNITLSNGGGTVSINDADSDPTNEIQDLQLVGNILTITNNGAATPVDLSIYRELPATAVTGQVLTWNGTAWVAQNAGSGADNWGSQVVVSDATILGDGTAGNPISVARPLPNTATVGQTITWNGTAWVAVTGFDGQYSSLSGTPTIPTQTSQLTNDSGFITSPNDADSDPTNELQTLSLAGSNLTLSNGGGTVSINDADSDPTNEIQNVSISGNALNISGGGTGTTIATNAPSTNQILTWNGTAWVAQNAGSGADNWGSQVVVSDATILGDGTAGNPISVARPLPNTATVGQTITWNGTAWVANNVAVVPTYASGTGVSITGTSPNFTINNTAPDQTVAITGTGATTVSGTYPSFTVTSTDNDNQTLTKTGNALSISGGNSINISNTVPATNQVLTWNGTNWIAATPAAATTYTAGTGININGSNVISNTAPDQTVVLNNGTGISVSGTYPNFTVTNTAPNQTVAITGIGATTVSGTYPNFTVSSTDNDNQSLTFASGVLSISGGNSVTIPTLPNGTQDQTLRHDGTNWVANSALVNDGSNIGIGTTAPQARLHVNQFINGAGAQQTITNTSTFSNSSSALSFTNSLTSQAYMIGIDNTNGTFKISNSLVNINGNNRFAINSNGLVGINNQSPNSQLDVVSPSFNLLRLTTTGANSNVNVDIFTTGVGSAQFTQNGGTGGYRFLTQGNGVTSVLEIQNNGRVAINTNALALSALDVNGQITMRTGAQAGYVPVSNAAGTMTWTDPNTLVSSGPWSKVGSTIHPTTNGDFVSIGGTNANTALSISGDDATTTLNANSGSPSTAIRLYNNNLVNNNYSSLAFATQISNGGSSEMAKIVGVNVNHTLGSVRGDLAFLTRGTSNINEVMRITGTGNVGIGTTAPISKLDIVNSTSDRTLQSANSFSSSNLKIAVFGNVTGTGTGDNISGTFDVTGSTGSNIAVSGFAYGTSGNKTGVEGVAEGNGGTKIGVRGSASGTGTNWAGYFESGNVYVQNNVGLGVTPTVKLHVNGALALVPNGANITVTNGATLTLNNPPQSYVRITSGTNGITLNNTTPISAGTAVGQILIIQNNSGNNITIPNSGTLLLNAPFTMGNRDTLLLIWTGANWLELSRSDN